MKEKLKIEAYTDGSCLGNPGVSGYAGIMKAKGIERVCVGYEANPKSTNNRAELLAVIAVVDWCNRIQKEPCDITIFTDSNYLVNCHTHNRSWLTSEGRPNKDLWIQLIEKGLKGGHKIKFVKVSGHAGVEENERADKLAREQAVKARHICFGGKHGRI